MSTAIALRIGIRASKIRPKRPVSSSVWQRLRARAPSNCAFDMFEGRIHPEGDRCSFEVLLGRTGLTDPALQAIA